MAAMGALTEAEIFDCMTSNLALAADLSDQLVQCPKRGDHYNRFRKALRLVEGTFRQAAVWREDARWLPWGLSIEKVHQLAGNWLRGIPQEGGGYIVIAEGQRHCCFDMLAQNLRAMLKSIEELRTKKTNRCGMILPLVQRGPHRDTIPVGWTRSISGLVIPGNVAA